VTVPDPGDLVPAASSANPKPATRWPAERLAEWATAAVYGTVLVLSALAAVDDDKVSSGFGWELLMGVGAATWVAHLYAEVVGDHLRHGAALERHELLRSMADGLPIPLAALPPAAVLLLGRLDVLEPRVALWVSVLVAVLQLMGVGALVATAAPFAGARPWWYAAVTGAIGLAVVIIKVLLGH
jgi:hypothetical protein